jgi:hypothetical protein
MNPVRLFVVRVWRRSHGFRAAVRRVDDDQTRMFTIPQQLVDYLIHEDDQAQAAPRDTGKKQ